MKKFLSLLGLLAFSVVSYASHIMGGDISYKYIGAIGNGLYRYNVTFTIYSNCDSQSNWPDGPPGSIRYAVYQEGFDPNADKPFIDQEEVFLSSSTKFTPDIPNGCTTSIDVCIYEAKYITTVDLPIMHNGNFSNGYHLYFDVCCRNDIINNLVDPGFTASAFYAFIPSPLVENNSPVFSDSPLPFLCAGSTTPLLNTAFDPDGDLLVFSFKEPYAGYSTATNPQPIYDDQTNPENDNFYPNLVWPIPTVSWETGFSATQPFTSSGAATINGFTGYSEYTPPAIGNYVVAVEIKEYRNGNLIGITRRDMQMIVINCPPNIPPNLSSAGSSGQTSYTIEEGANLCFDVIFNDTNGDNIELTSNGDIFNSSIVNPNATINTPQSGTGNVTANFCWDTECGQGRDQPYLFTVNATDDGCLPLTTPDVYSIKIKDFVGPTAINGKTNVCAGQLGEVYTVTNSSGATYTWTVNGGTIASGQGTNSITINWGNNSIGDISVETTSQYGCTRDAIDLLVNINEIPVDAGNDATICRGDTLQIGGNPTAPAGFNFNWSPSTGLDNSAAGNPNAFPTNTTTYIVSVYDGSGCFATDEVSISVNNAIGNVSNDTIICLGDTIQLNADGGSIYNWTPNTNIDDNTSPTPKVYPTSTTTYIVELQNTNGCESKDSVKVTIASPFNANAGSDQSVCSGNIVSIGGTPTGPADVTFEWSPSTYLDDPNLANPESTPLGDITYIVTVTDTIGCFDIDTMEVTLFNSPTAGIDPDFSICIGETTQLTATGGTSYFWSPNVSISDVNIANPDVNPDNDITYYVTVTNSDGCIDTDSLNITVNVPSITVSEETWLCETDSTTLEATGAVSYIWAPLDSIMNENTATPTVWPSDTTTYYVTATDANTCVSIDSVKIIVNTIVPTDAGPDVVICQYDSVVIGGNPTAPLSTIYEWNTLSGITDSTIANPTASVADTTKYWVVTLNHVCNGSDTVMVYTHDLPTVDAGSDIQICIGDTTTLTATGGVDYLWTPNDSIENINIDITKVWPTDTTLYYVTVTDANSCVNYDSVKVIVNPLPTISIIGTTPICFGDTSLVIAGGGESYSWLPTYNGNEFNNDSIFIFPEVDTTYTVLVTDSNNCLNTEVFNITVNELPNVDAGSDIELCIFDTTLIVATGAINYTWSPNYELTTTTKDSTYSFTHIDTIYYVLGIDYNGCQNTDSVRINVNTLPIINAGNDVQICINDSTLLVATGAVDYNWIPTTGLSNINNDSTYAAPNDTTTYIVYGTDANSCVNSDTVIVIVNPLPIIDAGDDTTACKFGTVIIGGTPTGPAGATYSWTPTTWINSNTTANPTTNAQSSITYYLQVTDTNSCVSYDSTRVNIFDIAAINDTSMCEGDTLQLFATTISGITPYTYNWSPTIGLSSTTSAITYATPEDDITYSISVTDNNGCLETRNIDIVVNNTPESIFDFSMIPHCDGMYATFTNSSKDADSYKWTFNGVDKTSEEIPHYLFPYIQVQTILLEATNQYGCYDSTMYSFDLADLQAYVDLKPPTVFSPNNDGYNEIFGISGEFDLAGCTEIHIFNRWGTLMFTSYGGNGWDGHNFSGAEVKEGVYFYVIDVKGMKFNGTVTLMR